MIALFFGVEIVFVSKATSVVESFAAPSFLVERPVRHIGKAWPWVNRLITDVH